MAGSVEVLEKSLIAALSRLTLPLVASIMITASWPEVSAAKLLRHHATKLGWQPVRAAGTVVRRCGPQQTKGKRHSQQDRGRSSHWTHPSLNRSQVDGKVERASVPLFELAIVASKLFGTWSW